MKVSVNSLLVPFLAAMFLVAIVLPSCNKDDNDDVAQNYVDYYLYINEPSNIALNAVGGWKYVAAGTKGIIVYRRSQTEFTALERNCTFDPNAPCSIVEVLSGISSIDSCCNSRFSIYDGSVINGPATQPLYQYRTTFDGTTLRIFN
jgi:nitrite reductase/ring-hydroxylating ferredoxin subunit